jgi:hypothetical protein
MLVLVSQVSHYAECRGTVLKYEVKKFYDIDPRSIHLIKNIRMNTREGSTNSK